MGPLAGVKVLEFEAIGPVPFCGMMLADMGADVLLVDRAIESGLGLDWSAGTTSCCADAAPSRSISSRPAASPRRRELARNADVVLEGFRPGVMERLGLGPDVLLAAQSEARRRPHDRLGPGRSAGAARRTRPQLHRDVRHPACDRPCRRRARAAAQPGRRLRRRRHAARVRRRLCLIEAQRSGDGQVVDAAMVEGASLLSTMFWGLRAGGKWSDVRGANILDTGAPWYDVYETLDHKSRRRRRHRTQVLRRDARAHGPCRRGAAAAARARTLAGTAAAISRRSSPRRAAPTGARSSRDRTRAFRRC